MDTLSQIEKSISGFTDQELSLFREWFFKFDNEKWDDKLEPDIEAGKLDEIAPAAMNQFLSGKVKSV